MTMLVPHIGRLLSIRKPHSCTSCVMYVWRFLWFFAPASIRCIALPTRDETWVDDSQRASLPLGAEFRPQEQDCHVPRIDVQHHSLESFYANFSHRKPFVLKGVAAKWPATHRWRLTELMSPNGAYASFENLGEMLSNTFPQFISTRPQEVVSEPLIFPDLLEEFPFSWECPYSEVTSQEGHVSGLLGANFMPLLKEKWQEVAMRVVRSGLLEGWRETPRHVYLIAGRAGSGGRLHVDPNAQAFWNAQVHGRKRWMFLRTDDLDFFATQIMSDTEKVRVVKELLDIPASVDQSLEQGKLVVREMLQQIPAKTWFGSLLPRLAAMGLNVSFDQVVVDPGDLIYGPDKMFHIVLALEDSIGCSEQLVDAENLEEFVRGDVDEYDARNAYLACAAGWASWPDLMQPLKKFCAKAHADVKSGSPSARRADL